MKYFELHEELPKLPVEFVTRILKIAEDTESFYKHRDRRARTESPENRKIIAATNGKSFPKIDLPEDVQCWVRTNIAEQAHEISVRKTVESGDHHFPHIDLSRRWVFLYLLENGGDDHVTIWYKDKSIVEPYPGIEYTSYDSLEEVARIQIPLQTWTLLNASVPHSVENIPNDRIAITVGLWHDPFS
jgi:hypothetical protein